MTKQERDERKFAACYTVAMFLADESLIKQSMVLDEALKLFKKGKKTVTIKPKRKKPVVKSPSAKSLCSHRWGCYCYVCSGRYLSGSGRDHY